MFTPYASSSSGGINVGDIPASLRFRDTNSAYISMAFAGTPQTYTLFMMVKRSLLGSSQCLTGSRLGGVATSDLVFDGSDQLRLELYNAYVATSTGKYLRDTTGWLPITLSVVQSGAINLYVADRLFASGTAGANSFMFSTGYTNVLGRLGDLAAQYFGGYMARFCFVAGTATDYTDFIEFNSTINEWVSKSESSILAVVNAGGADSRMYDFDDATSLTTLGHDKSSYANHATLNNFSLTAGPNYDHMAGDAPGRSAATFSPLRASSSVTHSNGNLTATASGGYNAFSTQPIKAKALIQFSVTSVSSLYPYIGLANAAACAGATVVGTDTSNNNWSYSADGGTREKNVAGSSYGTVSAGNVVTVAFDPATYKVWVAIGNTWQNSGNPDAGTGAVATLTADEYFAAIAFNTNSADVNFGQQPWSSATTTALATATTFSGINQANIPTPEILNPTDGFVSVSGLGSSVEASLASARSGWGSDPYLEIFECRSAGQAERWRFSVDSSNMLDGFSTAAKASFSALTAGYTYAGYALRLSAAYGTASGTVSHTNGVADTVTHNLSRSHCAIFLKSESSGAWYLYHPKFTAGKLCYYHTAGAEFADTSITAVGVNSFDVGAGLPSGTYRYVVIGEIDGFSSLTGGTGNASADGPLYNTGHAPAFAFLRGFGMSAYGDTFDADRNPSNPVSYHTMHRSDLGEQTSGRDIDFISNAIKVRNADGEFNAASGVALISFARAAAKYSLAR